MVDDFSHILERIADAISNFEVDMRAGRFAGRTDVADDLPLLHVLPRRHRDLRLMRVERLTSVRMFDDDVATVSRIPSGLLGDEDIALGGGENRRASRS